MKSFEKKAQQIDRLCSLSDNEEKNLFEMIELFSVFLSLNKEYTYNETYMKANIEKFIDYSNKYKIKKGLAHEIIPKFCFGLDESILISIDNFWTIHQGEIKYSDGLNNIRSNYICIDVVKNSQTVASKCFDIYGTKPEDIINYIKGKLLD